MESFADQASWNNLHSASMVLLSVTLLLLLQHIAVEHLLYWLVSRTQVGSHQRGAYSIPAFTGSSWMQRVVAACAGEWMRRWWGLFTTCRSAYSCLQPEVGHINRVLCNALIWYYIIKNSKLSTQVRADDPSPSFSLHVLSCIGANTGVDGIRRHTEALQFSPWWM